MDIYGTNANDTLTGTARGEDIYGRGGDDLLEGGAGNDDLYGGAGDDTLDGGAGNDDMVGGPGRDVFVFGTGRDSIEFFADGDRIDLAQSLGVGSFSEVLAVARRVDDGDDTLLDFGDGDSLLLEDVRLSTLTEGQFTFARAPAAQPAPPEPDPAPSAGGDRGAAGGTGSVGLSSDRDIYGTNANDTLTGTARGEDIYGRGGDDLLEGGAGNDDLYGGAGDDTLDGGAGNDDMVGGPGRDVFVFGTGRDSIEYLTAEDRIDLAPSLGVGSFSEVLAVARRVDDGDDTLLDFGDGDSLLLEDVRLSTLTEGQFTFARAPATQPASPEPDPAPSGGNEAGPRFVLGTVGAENVAGGSGDDILVGLGGADMLTGGAGADTFAFVAGALGAAATVSDFEEGDRLAFDDRFFGFGDGGIDERAPTAAEIRTILTDGLALFDRRTGELRLDLDGAGGADPVLLVRIEGDTRLTFDDVVFF